MSRRAHPSSSTFWKRTILIALLALTPTCTLAQGLSVEDRACITAAANKLPPVSALGIKGSRALPQPKQSKGQRNPDVYRVTVEIDVSVAGQSSTYVFNCVRDGQLTVIQPLGMRLPGQVLAYVYFEDEPGSAHGGTPPEGDKAR
jgi:hypothetical protein